MSVLHLEPGTDVTGAWAEVEAGAACHPDAEIGKWLHARPVAGQVAAGCRSGKAPASELADRLARVLTEATTPGVVSDDADAAWRADQLKASLTVAPEQLLEMSEGNGSSEVVALAFQAPAEGALSVGQLSARACRVHGEPGRTPELAGGALVQGVLGPAARCRAGDCPARLGLAGLAAAGADARPGAAGKPATVPAAGRRERARPQREHVLVSGSDASNADASQLPVLDDYGPAPSSKELDGWLEEAMARLQAIDSERLASRILQLQMADGLPDELVLNALVEVMERTQAPSPTCRAHRSAPLLRGSLALAYAALGKFARGPGDSRHRAPGTVRDDEAAEVLTTARWEIIRRGRGPDQEGPPGSEAEQRSRRASGPVRRARRWGATRSFR